MSRGCATVLGAIAVGGGSTIGLGKAIALRTDLPQIVVHTTYAGSEMTPILGQTKGGLKTTERTLRVLPEVVLYDVELTVSLPPLLSATSGLNSIAHAVEGLYARDGNPIVSLWAEEGVRALASALPAVIDRSDDIAARSDALYGAWLCGMVLGSAGMALHHKLCHTLGGTFDLPHAVVWAFRIKMMLLFLAGLNALWFWISVSPRVHSWGAGVSATPLAKCLSFA
jgi:alcohol dehydrogenase class IV